MLQEVQFHGKSYKLIVTQHAVDRMRERGIQRSLVKEILESGKSVKKSKKGKWWVYKKVRERNDNYVCLSISVEDPNLVVITTLINWRPVP